MEHESFIKLWLRIAHEVKAPVRAIQGTLEFVEEDSPPGLSPGVVCHLSNIRRHCGELNSLTDRTTTLLLMEMHPLTVSDLDLAQIAREVFESKRMAHCPEAEFSAPEHLPKRADAGLCSIILSELVDNSLTSLALKAKTGSKELLVSLESTGDGFALRDNGVGFNQQYAEQMLEPFEKLHSMREFPGNGLGLALANAAAKRHRGELSLSGTEGKGAVATFRLGEPPETG